MEPILDKIKEKVIVGDGAMGTMLQACGLTGGQAPEKWVLNRPEDIKNIHLSYIKAGAELIETNTFGGNRLKLTGSGLEQKRKKINQQAVKLARAAAAMTDKTVFVAGSVGPTGKLMQPYGELDYSTAREVFSEQIGFLVEAGVDAVIIETMNDLQEMRAALTAAVKKDVPVIAQMTFTENMFTLSGNTPEVAAVMLEALGADVIGVNCTPGSTKSLPMIKRIFKVTDKPLSIFPNAGVPSLEDGETVYPSTPAEFIAPVAEILKNGVRIMGGCCGTNPDYIRTLYNKIKQLDIEIEKKSKEKKIYLSSYRQHLEITETDTLTVSGNKIDLKSSDITSPTVELSKDKDILYLALDSEKNEEIYPLKRLMDLINDLQLPLLIYSTDKKTVERVLKLYRGKPGLILTCENEFLLEINKDLPVALIVNTPTIQKKALKRGWKQENIIHKELGVKRNTLQGLLLNR